jgi:hypothetical protein
MLSAAVLSLVLAMSASVDGTDNFYEFYGLSKKKKAAFSSPLQSTSILRLTNARSPLHAPLS